MTVIEAFRRARDALARAGVDSPEVDAWWLLEAATGSSRARLIVERGRPLGAAERAAFESFVERRTRREPLQHIVGATEFYGLHLAVDRRALVPRPETERLVELALERLASVAAPRVLDVGTGSGAIAVALASARPDATVMATDLSGAALELAARNVERHGLDVGLERSDLLSADPVAAFASSADVIVANLPYLPAADRDAAAPEVRLDPPAALYGGPHGTEVFMDLLDQAFALLPAGSWLLAELDPRNVHGAAQAARGWGSVAVEPDLAGRDRFLLLRR